MSSVETAKCHTILVIEDDEVIRDGLKELLEMEGYSVLTAENGKAGMDILHTARRPCLILLDLMMPIMDGWEFLGALRNDPGVSLAIIPVIITSAAGNSAITAAKQAQGLIKKPIDFELLLSAVKGFCHSSAEVVVDGPRLF